MLHFLQDIQKKNLLLKWGFINKSDTKEICQVSKFEVTPFSGPSAGTILDGYRWKRDIMSILSKHQQTEMAGGGMLIESSLGQFGQDLYGDDLVAAMIKRVNFTVNHFHQVNFP